MRITTQRIGQLGKRHRAFIQHFTANIPGLLERAGRLYSVALSKYTQPYRPGGDQGREIGETAVKRDVNKVYATAQSVFGELQKIDPKLADAFYAAISESKFLKAQQILQKSGSRWRNVPIGEFDPSLHKQARNSRGRVSASRTIPSQIVALAKPFLKYLAQEVRNVGIGKAGWAACAEILGGARGIPQWVTRHKKLASAYVDRSRVKDKTYPQILLTNGVPWVRSLITEDGKQFAIRESGERLTKSIEAAAAAAEKKARAV